MQALLFRHSVPRQIITRRLWFANADVLFAATAPMHFADVPAPRLPARERRSGRQASPGGRARGARPLPVVRTARLDLALERRDRWRCAARAAHPSMTIPIPDGVPDEAAVLADPFSVSLRTCREQSRSGAITDFFSYPSNGSSSHADAIPAGA
jgi:hypothetical protein